MKKKINIILVIIWMIVIFMMSSFDANTSSNQSNFIVDIIVNIFNIRNIDILSFIVRKLAHFTEYLILGILVYNLIHSYNKKVIVGIVICILYAVSDEIHQLFVDIYVRLLDIYVNIEINREYFNVVKIRNLIYSDRLYSMLLKQGKSLDDLDKIKFVQININVSDKNDISGKKLAYGTDLLVTYGLKSKKVYNSNKLVLIRF